MKSKKTWKDITLAKAMELMQLEAQMEAMEPIDFMVERIAILEDKDPAEVENQTPKQIFEQNEAYSFLARQPLAKFVPSIKVNGKEYGVAPLDKITLAQMVDIEEYYKVGLEKNLDKIISILVLPVKEKSILGKRTLEDYEYDEERAEELKSLDMEFVWQNILFFCAGVERYMDGFQDFLQKETMKTEKTKLTGSLPNMMTEYNKTLVARPSRTLRERLGLISTKSGAGSE